MKNFFKMKTRFTFLIFLACMSINTMVCNAQGEVFDKISPTDKNISYEGRVLVDDEAAHLFYPGTSISITVKLGEGENFVACFNKTIAYYWIEISGQKPYKVGTEESGFIRLPVPSNEVRTIRITLASEGIYHNPQFYGFTVVKSGGDLLYKHYHPAGANLRFEFIGNSITCGYGTEVTDRSPFNDSTSNFCHGYAYLTAKAFDAEIMTVARSGIGIYRNYGEKDSALYYGCMPDNYEKLWLDSDKKWDFSKFTPDLLFINLGTNDTWEMSSFNTEKYEKNFRKLMDMVTAHYPTTTVVLLTGSMMGPEALAAVKPILDQLQKDYSTKKRLVYRFDFTPVMGDGADWHPSAAQQQKMSEELIPFVKKLIEKQSK